MSYDFFLFGPPGPTTYDEAYRRYLAACEGAVPQPSAALTPEVTAYREWLVERWPSLSTSAEAGDDAAGGNLLLDLSPPDCLFLLCSWQNDAVQRLGVPAVDEAVTRGFAMLNPQIERLFTQATPPEGIGPE